VRSHGQLRMQCMFLAGDCIDWAVSAGVTMSKGGNNFIFECFWWKVRNIIFISWGIIIIQVYSWPS
jgi:hypothetical protein